MSAKVVSKGIVSVGSWSIAKSATAAVVLPILARLLGIEGYGQYAYYLAVLLLASQCANVGMMQTMTKRIAERPDDLAWCRAVALPGAVIHATGAVTVGLLMGLLLVNTAPPGTAAVPIALVVVGVLWLDQIWFFARGVLFGLRREERATIPGIIGVVMAGALGVALAARGMGVTGVFTGLLVSNLFVAVVCLRAVVRSLDTTGRDKSDRVPSLPTQDLLRFGLSAMAFSVLNMALCALDVILVRHLAGETQAGLYAAAVQWSQFVWFIPIAVEGVMLQSTAPLWAKQRIGDVAGLVSRLLRYVLLGTAFLLVLVASLGHHIVTLYFGAQFAEAALGLRLLVPGAFCYAMARVLWPVIQASGEGAHLIRVIGATVLVDVGLCWAWVPSWGAAGAALATSVSFALVALGYVRLLRRRQLHIFEGWAVSRLLALVVATGTAVAGFAALVETPLLSVVGGIIVGVFVYWSGVFWFGLLQVEEVERMVQSLPGVLRQVGDKIFRYLQPVLLRLQAAG
ncbi:MAG: oligosaccharide flippase family protein [Nitrospirota bacterium]|nr:oligosaccharide flippase family protein [Nitrospirota bacterium]